MAYMPPPALLHQSWPRLKHSPIAFAVASPYHAVAVFVGIHLPSPVLLVTVTTPPLSIADCVTSGLPLG